jgi:hypothetical protein
VVEPGYDVIVQDAKQGKQAAIFFRSQSNDEELQRHLRVTAIQNYLGKIPCVAVPKIEVPKFESVHVKLNGEKKVGAVSTQS